MATTSNYGWPTPDDTDLVRDGAAAIRAFGSAVDGTLLGIGKNVVQSVLTATTSIAAGVEGTIISVTITPSSATSRVLLLATTSIGAGSGGVYLRFSGGNAEDFRGDAAGSRRRSAVTIPTAPASFGQQGINLAYLDSPGTASAVTYNLLGLAPSVTLYINRSDTDSNNTGHSRSATSLIAIEVAP